MSGAGFGIYVHWPFCAAKCPYCDFNSHVRSEIDDTAWAGAIARELEHMAALQGGARTLVQSVFFGGGTPSLMRGAAAGAVLNTIAKLWPVANDVEITLEANPASAEAARFADYRAAGINRVSLGVQALNDADLKFLGRLHNVAEAKAALAMAMQNFERVSLDLIYARPGQTLDAWEKELSEALAFGTEHLSLYQLTIEPQTPFAARGIVIPDDDHAVALYERTQAMTNAAGRPAYEISNHASPGAECRHNLIYWRYGDYAGAGPGAHGRLQIGGKRLATLCERLPERWQDQVRQEGHGIVEVTEISAAEAAREHLLMGLRLREGIDLDAYRARWGTAPHAEKIAALAADGFLVQTGSQLAATPKGVLVLNRLIAELA
ncbi:MAG: coproporphyrinogen III oxidase [Alphaproteobacteria bacterium]|nr:coproporphyrinogen III oxidase [Alphaproteobacteria bacterium]MBU6472994.1 coproporphyrinogen III oxidase [Alphaproteobacteria bacterium]MDE2072854.1 coproporphyrinogen III oxidase [Alphaproteobacteria bacterium]MDE2351718.1 coproporphyrinogen III oxidase [Alphaproteobacteria bacterium]